MQRCNSCNDATGVTLSTSLLPLASERFRAIYRTPDCYVAAHGRRAAHGIPGLQPPAHLVAATGGFSPHPGHRPISGASPDVMVSSVTTPLERQFGQISGLAQM